MPPPRMAPMAAPRMAPQISAPRTAGPRVAPQMPQQLARPSGGPSPSAVAGSAPTQRTIAAQGQTVRNLAGPAAAIAGQGGRDRPNLNVAGPQQPGGPSAPNVRDPSPRTFQLAGVNQPNSNRMLRNPALAERFSNTPGGTLEGPALARATFQGGWWKHHHHHHHHHHRYFKSVFVIGFVGPVFWPYAYYDFVDYTFYPYAYDTFWPSAYDDVYDGMYGPYALDDGYDGGSYPVAGRPQGSGVSAGGAGGRAAGGPAARDICTGKTADLTDWPIERISKRVEPNEAQRGALDELKTATATALKILKAACPTDLPSTPTRRLEAMHKRLDAMSKAVRTVRPALQKFYLSLGDEQKARFNALRSDKNQQQAQGDLSQLCGQRAAGIGNLPTERIETAVQPTEAQRVTLKELQDAMAGAGNVLTLDCPSNRPLTPVARLEAMEQRLNAMLRAVTTVQPALERFYASLSDEQKERFNRLGPAQS
jgi:LTXXQ motif family protein